MEVVMTFADRLSEHVMTKFVERWIGPVITKHWIVSLVLMAIMFSTTAVGWYRRKRVL